MQKVVHHCLVADPRILGKYRPLRSLLRRIPLLNPNPFVGSR